MPYHAGLAATLAALYAITSLARPSGNLTGVNLIGLELTAKRLELLREMLPGAARVAVLVNPANTANTQYVTRGGAGTRQS
jgi:putative ABC transport system substrate-binding protein